MQYLKPVLIWLLAALFFSNSLAVTIRNNLNFGTLVLWLITAALTAYGIFHKQLDRFFSAGFGRGVFAALLCGIGFFLFMFAFVAVSGNTHSARGNEKAIIVLGAGLRGEEVSDTLRRRLEAALAAWQDNPEAYLVVTGGKGEQELIPEAVAMQRWLLAKSVPEDKIIVEDQSISTETNLGNALALLAEKGITAQAPLALCSNAFHCYRAREYAQKLGMADIRSIPASMGLPSLLQSYIREIFAILYMWVFKAS